MIFDRRAHRARRRQCDVAVAERRGGGRVGLRGSRRTAAELMTTVHIVGFILGREVCGLMIDDFGWRWSFYLRAPLEIIGTVLASTNMKRRRDVPSLYFDSTDYLGPAWRPLSCSSLASGSSA